MDLNKLVALLYKHDALDEVRTFIQQNPTKLNEKDDGYSDYNEDSVRGRWGTLLHFSCLFHRPKVVSYLLSQNADVTKGFVDNWSYNGLTAQQIAEKRGYVDIVNLFVIREQAVKEQAAREQAAREQAEREQATREQDVKEQVAREQAAREQATREQAVKEQAVKEQAVKEQAVKEQAAREQAVKEQAAKEQAAKEQAAKEQAAKEQTAKELAAKEQAVKEQTAKEQAVKEQAAREQAVKEQTAREQAAKEQAATEHAVKEQAAKEQAVKEQAVKEQAAKEQAVKKQAVKEQSASEQDVREQAEREKIYQFLNQLGFSDTVIQKIENHGVSKIEDSLSLPPFQKNRIINILTKEERVEKKRVEKERAEKEKVISDWFGCIYFGDFERKKYSKLFVELGFDDLTTISLMEEKEMEVNFPSIPVGHQKRIWQHIKTFKKKLPVSRAEPRREAPTTRIHPGIRFLEFVPKAPTDQKSVVDCLTTWASSKKLDTFIIDDMVGKIEDFTIEGHSPTKSLSLSMCWLYTTDSWVYKEINTLLREDASSIRVLAPYMNGLIKSYNQLENDSTLFFGTVYRRTKLDKKVSEFYKPNTQFVWSAFTSTSMEDPSSDIFGDTLFVITVPESFKKYALNLDSVSLYKAEKEVLLLPNMGYIVKATQQGPIQEYPNTTLVIHLDVAYVCLT